LNYALLNQIL